MPRCKAHVSRKIIEQNSELGDIIEICSCEYSPDGLPIFAVTLGCIATFGFGLLVVGGVCAANGTSWLEKHRKIFNYEYNNHVYDTLAEAIAARKEQERKHQEQAKVEQEHSQEKKQSKTTTFFEKYDNSSQENVKKDDHKKGHQSHDEVLAKQNVLQIVPQ